MKLCLKNRAEGRFSSCGSVVGSIRETAGAGTYGVCTCDDLGALLRGNILAGVDSMLFTVHTVERQPCTSRDIQHVPNRSMCCALLQTNDNRVVSEPQGYNIRVTGECAKHRGWVIQIRHCPLSPRFYKQAQSDIRDTRDGHHVQIRRDCGKYVLNISAPRYVFAIQSWTRLVSGGPDLRRGQEQGGKIGHA